MQGPQGSNAAPDAGAPALLGGCRLLELLGRGGMGEVYRGEREGPGGYRRRAAIKRILPRFLNDPTLRARFLAEARINARLEHPNIVQVLEAGDQPEPFLVLEFVEGTTLAKVLKKCAETRQRIAPAAVAFLIAEAATGLDYAHRRTDDNGQPLQIIHRDVSPQNLLISVDGVVKVSDFGIARAADNQIRTAAGITVGKIAYMAPEQASGRAFDWRADVFALGVVLWETLLVRPLIPRNDSNAALQLLVSGRFEPPSRVDPALPPQLDAIVMGALAVDPNARTSSAGLLAQQLRTLCHAISPGFDGRELARSLSALMPEVPWQLSGGAAPDPGRPQSGMYQAPPAGAAPLAGMGAGAVLGGIGSQPLGAGAMGVAPGGALPMGGGMPGAGMPGGSLPMGGGMPGAGMPGGSLPMGGGMPGGSLPMGGGVPGGSLPMGGGMPPGGALPMGGAPLLGNPAMGLPGLNPMGNPPPLAGPPPRPDGGSRPSPVVNTDSGDRPIAPPPPPKVREPMSTRTKTYLIAGAMVFVVLLVFLWITRWRLNDMAVGHGGPSIVVDGGGAAPVVRRLPPPDEHPTEVVAPPVRNYYPLACAAVDRLEPQVIACLGANRRVVDTTVAQVAFSNATGNVSGTTINFTGERDRRRVPVLRQCITTALAGAHFATDAGAVGFTTCERTWSMSRRMRGGGGGVSDEIRFPFGHPE